MKRDQETDLDKFNEYMKGMYHFYLVQSNMNTITFAGSFDLCYYHNVEVTFHGVTYMQCHLDYGAPIIIRYPSKQEIVQLGYQPEILSDEGLSIFCIFDEDNYLSFIIAENISFDYSTVFYYLRENLQDGERIADWVKLKNIQG
jgi:hypothetical protein